MQPRKINWVLTLIMSFFFGSFGVDRFMMGQVGTGILKLITFGGFGIWWLVDFCLIASKYQFFGIEWVGPGCCKCDERNDNKTDNKTGTA